MWSSSPVHVKTGDKSWVQAVTDPLWKFLTVRCLNRMRHWGELTGVFDSDAVQADANTILLSVEDIHVIILG